MRYECVKILVECTVMQGAKTPAVGSKNPLPPNVSGTLVSVFTEMVRLCAYIYYFSVLHANHI